MIKLQCTKCGKIWYTANTVDNQLCDDCWGELIVVSEKNEKKTVDKKVSNSDSVISA